MGDPFGKSQTQRYEMGLASSNCIESHWGEYQTALNNSGNNFGAITEAAVGQLSGARRVSAGRAYVPLLFGGMYATRFAPTRNRPLTRPAPAGESAVAGHPLPRGRARPLMSAPYVSHYGQRYSASLAPIVVISAKAGIHVGAGDPHLR
jgi:hypothetical protein